MNMQYMQSTVAQVSRHATTNAQ